jgi:hypothetical protein
VKADRYQDLSLLDNCDTITSSEHAALNSRIGHDMVIEAPHRNSDVVHGCTIRDPTPPERVIRH